MLVNIEYFLRVPVLEYGTIPLVFLISAQLHQVFIEITLLYSIIALHGQWLICFLD